MVEVIVACASGAVQARAQLSRGAPYRVALKTWSATADSSRARADGTPAWPPQRVELQRGTGL